MQTVKNKRNVLVIVGHDAEPADPGRRPAAARRGHRLHAAGPGDARCMRPNSRPTGPTPLDRAERNAETIRAAGLEVVETIVGDADFAAAAGDVLHSREIDDVVVLVDPEAALGARPDLVAV